jgi:hypothetical protein
LGEGTLRASKNRCSGEGTAALAKHADIGAGNPESALKFYNFSIALEYG